MIGLLLKLLILKLPLELHFELHCELLAKLLVKLLSELLIESLGPSSESLCPSTLLCPSTSTSTTILSTCNTPFMTVSLSHRLQYPLSLGLSVEILGQDGFV